MATFSPKPKIKELQTRTLVRWPRLSYGALPLVIMLLVIIVCLIGYGLSNANVELSRGRSIDRRLLENKIRTDAVFDSYAHLMWGSTGRVQSAAVDEESWEKFISIFDIPNNFSGMEAVGLVYGTTPANATIVAVSPETPQTMAIKSDVSSQKSLQQQTMIEAARTGTTTIGDPLPNLFSTKQNVATTHNGFLMYAPFYNEALPTSTPDQRQQAVSGYTIAMFRGDIFFDKLFKNVDLSHSHLKIYLGEPVSTNLLYETGKTTSSHLRTVSQEISEYGKTFTILYTFDVDNILVFSQNYLPQILVFAGLLVGMIIAGVSGYMLRNRYRRLTLEKEQAVNFAKDELLSLASHQLRTPATGVKQYLGMVLQGFAGDLNEQQRIYLERAYASNNRQLHVINDILHMAKIEAGRIVLSEREFNIAAMVHEVVDEQRLEATKGEVHLILKAPTRGLMVGDNHLLRMVVENLVSNAIKYTPEGGTVSVRLHRRNNHWIITVKDTGVGIAKSDYNKLFQQFSRINNSRSDYVTGTGVGLYLAHHLTVLHGGTIGVSSTKGKGSTFTVRLPRKM